MMILLSPLLLLVPFFAAGVLRTAFGLPFSLALGLGTVLALALAVGSWRALRGSAPKLSEALEVWGLAILFTGFAVWVLGVSKMGGLVTIGGGDAGNHVWLQRAWLERDPGLYYGFTTFYALTSGLERVFGLDPFQTLGIACVAILATGSLCTVVAVTAIAKEILPEQGARPARLILALLLLLTGVAVLLPVLGYHQSEGFYPQLFGLVPLFVGWCLYGLVNSLAGRVLVLLGGMLFYRFTYGLNLGDFAGAATVLFALETRITEARILRWFLAVLSGGFVIGAIILYLKLTPLVYARGGVLRPDMREILVAEVVLGIVLLWGLQRGPGGPTARRLALFAVAFLAWNVMAQVSVWLSHAPREYYFYKYHLHGVVLGLAATLVWLAGVVGSGLNRTVVPRQRPLRPALIPLLLFGFAAVLLTKGFSVYRQSFLERLHGTPPFVSVQPLADRPAWRAIQQILKERKKAFGGLLAPSWPLSGFMNASLGPPLDQTTPRSWQDYQGFAAYRVSLGDWPERSGYCLFWFEGPSTTQGFESMDRTFGGSLSSRVRELAARPERSCIEYPRPWEPERDGRLCTLCR